MEIKVYLHRTKKKQFAVADAFTIDIDCDQLTEKDDFNINTINEGFSNDVKKIALGRDCVKKYGTGYISFMRPQFEGKEEDNGNAQIYFDNNEMLFQVRQVSSEGEKNGK